MKSILGLAAFVAVVAVCVCQVKKPCSSQDDCTPAEECCVLDISSAFASIFKPFATDSASEGECKKMGEAGEPCSIGKPAFSTLFNFKSDLNVFSCPCKADFECTQAVGAKSKKNHGTCQPPPAAEDTSSSSEEAK